MKSVRYKSLLADLYGPWCAWCLETIQNEPANPADRLQYHHVAQELLRGRPSLPPCKYNWDAWVVPVHQKCHQSILDRYSAAATFLLTLRLEGVKRSPLAAERAAIEMFDKGLYPFCVIVHQALRAFHRDSAPNPGEQQDHFRIELLCAAGIWFFECPELEKLDDLLILAPNAAANPDYTAFLINPFGTFGKVKEVNQLTSRIRSVLRNAPAEAIRARMARAEAYVLGADKLAAKRAEDRSKEFGAHQRRSAKRVLAWTQLASGDHQDALSTWESLQDFGSPTSFFERMHGELLGGCVQYLAHDRCIGQSGGLLENVVKQLLRAQYLVACVGLKGWVLPHMHKFFPYSTSPWLNPGDVLDAIVTEHVMRCEHVYELRLEGLAELQREVWTTIAGLGAMKEQ